ncbi:MAG: imidazole glycerol phosphate synthase subunit HisH [Vicinamibacterales bacterium]
MTPRLALIDYGAGNLTSVRKGFAAAGAELYTPVSPADIRHAAGIVVPGVGHFSATASLHDGWRASIHARLQDGIPLLGICLGMQWLFEGSAEAPGLTGLGVMRGSCTRIAAAAPLKVPHVGWNRLTRSRDSALLHDVPADAHVYFTHAYAAPVTSDCIATCRHGSEFAAAVEREHVCGVQFHPEKSSDAGLRILRNFVAMVGT